MKRTVAVLILDGWGEGRNDTTNPLVTAGTPNLDALRKRYRHGLLQASGLAVGLPWGEEGNSEVGHLTIGAGRTILQHLPRISDAIKNGSFFENPALVRAAEHAKKNNGTIHLVTLLSEGHVHAAEDHLRAMITLSEKAGVKKILIHAISDGKDSRPRSIRTLLGKIRENESVRIASLSGRYYAMDRDRHLDRIARAYGAITGKDSAREAETAETHIEETYARGLNDEFIEPVRIRGAEKIAPGDAVIFCNFREDGIRELASAFSGTWTGDALEPLPENLFVTTMTRYENASKAEIAFPPEDIQGTLGDAIAEAGVTQMRIAETEKYAHVTYFFNGLRSDPLPNEYRILVPSENIARHDERPEMMTREIASRAMQAIEEGIGFVLVNFAAPDMIAHTGNFKAAMEAARAADREVGNIAKAALARGATLIITADHGNIEQMRDPVTGMPETRHNPNPVPICIVGEGFALGSEAAYGEEENAGGVLADIAPTVLDIMGIPKPKEMTGNSLLGRL